MIVIYDKIDRNFGALYKVEKSLSQVLDHRIVIMDESEAARRFANVIRAYASV